MNREAGSEIINVEEVAGHVKGLFAMYEDSFLFYHNLDHTVAVVSHVLEIAANYNLTASNKSTLVSAAWFHDTGHLFGIDKGHEIVSAEIAVEWMTGKNVQERSLAAVVKCILATELPARPSAFIEKIICDADCWHLGTGDFFAMDKLVWEEFTARHGPLPADKLALSIKFLEQHEYFTDYCKQLLGPAKAQNLAALKNLEG